MSFEQHSQSDRSPSDARAPANKADPAAERVVIYRLGSLGDTVVALPCLHKIAEAFPHSERVMLTNFPVQSKAAPLEAILGGSGLVHRFVAYPIGMRAPREILALRKSLRALDAKVLIYLSPSRGLQAAWRDLLFFRLCGFRRIIGAPLTNDLQRTRRGSDGLVERECERLARCMAPLGEIDLRDAARWDLHITADERALASSLVADLNSRPLIAINMGGKVEVNDWGEANWTALVERMRNVYSDHALIFVGSSEDAQRAERVGARWGMPFLNLCGRVSPRVSAAAMSGARLFVGHDSGPLHLAASTGVACVGLFGSHNEPRRWHPFGDSHRVIHEMRGVQAISVDRVLQAIGLGLAGVRSSSHAPRQAALRITDA